MNSLSGAGCTVFSHQTDVIIWILYLEQVVLSSLTRRTLSHEFSIWSRLYCLLSPDDRYHMNSLSGAGCTVFSHQTTVYHMNSLSGAGCTVFSHQTTVIIIINSLSGAGCTVFSHQTTVIIIINSLSGAGCTVFSHQTAVIIWILYLEQVVLSSLTRRPLSYEFSIWSRLYCLLSPDGRYHMNSLSGAGCTVFSHQTTLSYEFSIWSRLYCLLSPDGRYHMNSLSGAGCTVFSHQTTVIIY